MTPMQAKPNKKNNADSLQSQTHGFTLSKDEFEHPALLAPPLIFVSLQPHRILQALRRYVRAENKDRQHTIRHYQHVLAVDPEKAAQMKSQVSCLTEMLREKKALNDWRH